MGLKKKDICLEEGLLWKAPVWLHYGDHRGAIAACFAGLPVMARSFNSTTPKTLAQREEEEKAAEEEEMKEGGEEEYKEESEPEEEEE
jgi:hypothetical protein